MTATLIDVPHERPIHGSIIGSRAARTPGQLWERASDLDRHTTNARGVILAYRVSEGRGNNERVLSHQYATRAEAQERLEAEFTPAFVRMFGARVIVAPYFTRSGRVIKRD